MLREAKPPQPALSTQIVEEKTRMLALKVFEGDLVPKDEHKKVLEEKNDLAKTKNELETKLTQLETRLQESEKNREAVIQEKQFLETVKTNFEGCATLSDLRNHVLLVLELRDRAKSRGKTCCDCNRNREIARFRIEQNHKQIDRSAYKIEEVSACENRRL